MPFSASGGQFLVPVRTKLESALIRFCSRIEACCPERSCAGREHSNRIPAARDIDSSATDGRLVSY